MAAIEIDQRLRDHPYTTYGKHNRFLDPPSLKIHLGQCPSSLHVHIFPSLYVIEQDATDVLHLLKTSK